MDVDCWARALWSFVEAQHIPGRPFYLCVTPSTLLQLYLREKEVGDRAGDLTERDVEENFHRACLEHWNVVTERRLVLAPAVFRRRSWGRSLAIAYAAQQVLAAERMASDSRAGRDEYYARYWEVIGLGDSGFHGCPLNYAQFERVWQTLRAELLRLPGASAETITFHRLGGRKEKYRSLPLSQSLLDHHALLAIRHTSGVSEQLGDHELIQFLRRKARDYSQRTQRKLYTSALASAIVRQVRDFLESTRTVVEGRGADRSNVEHRRIIGVTIIEDGWEDRYVFHLVRDDGSGVRDSAVVIRSLEQACDRAGVALFGDHSVVDFVALGHAEARAGVPVRLVVAKRYAGDGGKVLDPQWAAGAVEVPSSLPLPYVVFVHSSSEGWVRFADQGSRHRGAAAIQLLGGVVADARHRTYLASFPPRGVAVSGRPLRDTARIIVNGQKTACGKFFAALVQSGRTSHESRYSLQAGELEIRFGVTRHREEYSEIQLGFALSINGLSAHAIEGASLPRFRHWGFDGGSSLLYRLLCEHGDRLSKHLRICESRWLPVSVGDAMAVSAALSDSAEPFIRRAARRVGMLRRMPPGLFRAVRRRGTS